MVRERSNDVGVKGLLGDLDDEAVAARAGAVGLSRLLPALRGGLPRTQIDGTIERKIPRLHDSILPHPRHILIQASPFGGGAGREAPVYRETAASSILCATVAR